MKITHVISLLIVLIFMATGTVYPSGKKPPGMVDKSIEGRIASIFNVDKSLVVSLENMGYNEEEIIRTLFIYVATGTPIFKITKLYKQGTKWGDISEKYGIDINVFNKETINMLIYIGKVKKTELTENQILSDKLFPQKGKKYEE